MKKIVLSLAGVLAATAFAPEASALPAFARQTGMACTACHFQHFPVLNSFGRAFRAAGYTMMGAQGKVEGEHLSLPDTLNAGVLIKARYQKGSGTDAAGTVSGTTVNGGQWQFPDELVVLFGGRIAENVGFLLEMGLAGAPAPTHANAAGVGGLKLPFIYDVGGAKLGITPFLTDTQGPFFGYDQSSSGQVRASRWSEERAGTSSQNYTGLSAGAATGIALSASSDMGYVALSRFAPHHASNGGTGAVQYRSNALRIAATPTVGDWALHVGGGFISGSNYAATAPAVGAALADTKGTTLDFQAQGQVAGKDMSVYVNYGKANAGTAAVPNLYNGARVTDRKALVIAADYSVIPHVLSLGAAYRKANTGLTAAQQLAGAGDKDNAVTVQAVYDLYQNVALHLAHKMQNGSAYDNRGLATAGTQSGATVAKNLTTFMLEMAW